MADAAESSPQFEAVNVETVEYVSSSGLKLGQGLLPEALNIPSGGHVLHLEHVPENVDWRTITSTSSGTSQLAFSLDVPAGYFLDRHIWVEATLTATLTATGAADPAQGYVMRSDAVRQMPLMSCCNGMTVQIGGTSYTCQPANIYHELLKYVDRRDFKTALSTFPNQPDHTQHYFGLTSSSVNVDPLGQGGDSEVYLQRGNYPNVSFTAPAGNPGSFTITVRTIEPVLCGPFCWPTATGSNKLALAGFANNNVSLNMSLSGVESALWYSRTNGANAARVLTGQVGSIVGGSVKLHYGIYQALPEIPIPPVIYYDYRDFAEAYQSAQTPINSNATATLTSSIIKLPSIPSQILVYITEPLSERNLGASNSYLPISAISVLFNGRSVLSAASVEELYHLSVKNGFNEDYFKFNAGIYQATASNAYGSGPVLCLTPEDLGLSKDYVPSSIANTQIQISVVCKNTSVSPQTVAALTTTPAAARNVVLYVVPVFDNLTRAENGQYTNIKGVVSAADVMKSRLDLLNDFREGLAVESSHPLAYQALMGSGLFGSFGRFLRRAGKFAWKGVKFLGKHVALPVAKQVAKEALLGPAAVAVSGMKGEGVLGGELGGMRDNQNLFRSGFHEQYMGQKNKGRSRMMMHGRGIDEQKENALANDIRQYIQRK